MPPLTPADDRQSRPTRSAIEAVRPPDLSTAVLNVLWGDGEFVLSRAVRGERLPSLLTLTPASSRPAAVTVERLESSYALRDELDPAWAALPLAVVRYDGRPTLLLADEGGMLEGVKRASCGFSKRRAGWLKAPGEPQPGSA